MQNDRQASTTIYEPGSFVPMLRVDKQLQADDRRAKGELRTYHVHCNHLGTPEALIAQDSLELVWQIELDPWGQPQREYNPNNMLQPIRMQGQQLDAETGLFYNRYRYYDPAGGRYITQDPIGLAGGVNLYGYVGNPNQWVDSLGLVGSCPSSNCKDAEETPLWKKIVPSTKEGWADYLGKQSDYFGAAAIGMTYIGVLAPAAPIAAGISALADAGSKMLKPVGNIVLVNDTVIDIVGSSAPGGFAKDVALTAYKKLISTASELGEAEKSKRETPLVKDNMCKRSNY